VASYLTGFAPGWVINPTLDFSSFLSRPHIGSFPSARDERAFRGRRFRFAMNLFKRILFGSFGNYSKLLFGLLIGSDVGRPSHDREFCSRDFGHYTMIAFPT